MPETLLVMGASIYHLEAIRAARELGVRVITVDGNPSAPGHSRADKGFTIEPYDVPAVLEIVRAQQVSGMLAVTSSAAYLPAAWLSATLGFTGIAPESADVFADKLRFRELITELGLPHPQTHALREGGRLPTEIFDGARWLIKPDRGWASRGVFVITSREEFERFYPITLAFSPTQTGLLERHVQGQQGVAQGILRAGKVEPLLVMDRTSADEPFTSLTSLRMPSRLPQHLRKQLAATLEQVFGSLKLTDCVFHADFLAGDGKLYILGISPTLGGYGMAKLIRQSTGADMAKYAVLHSLGNTPELPTITESKPGAVAVLGTKTAGRLEFDTQQAESFVDIPWIQGMSWDKPRGSAVKEFTSGDRRVGQFSVTADDRDQLDARVNEALRRLNLRAE